MSSSSNATPTTSRNEGPAGPATWDERISAVDVLRGVAVLGILLINIEDFGLLHSDKSAAGTEWVGVYLPAGFSHRAVIGWTILRALFEGKMRAIFSMLFGAGLVLLTSRLEQRGERSRAADIYFRRTLWLLLFGILHAYFLWEGDILYSYAISGLFLFPFRHLAARTLIVLGALLLSISVPRAAVVALHRRDLRSQAAAAIAAATVGKTPTRRQETAKTEWDEIMEDFQPDAATLQETRDDYHGGYGRLFARRAPLVRYVESSDFYGWAFFDTAGMMLVGMGLIKTKVLRSTRSRRFYGAMAAIGFGLGLPISAAATYQLYVNRFDPVAVAWTTAVYDPGRIAVALAHVALVMLLVKAKRMRWLTRVLADVGRMALTNYLAATVICTTLFNGYGFGLFGSLRRHQLYLIAFSIWFVQLSFSRLWLAAFRFGPVEWLWRSLTYWKPQPFHLKTVAMDDP